jgi:hypothetical protein
VKAVSPVLTLMTGFLVQIEPAFLVDMWGMTLTTELPTGMVAATATTVMPIVFSSP